MKRVIAGWLLLASSAAFAQEPALVHGPFGFQPKGAASAALTEAQKKDLDECVALAKQQAGAPKEDKAAVDALYGLKPGQTDMYGAILSGCLGEDTPGKGWSVLKRSGQGWELVTARHALRSFMGMDPSR